ncbi:MAG: hypothetical protein ACK6DB_01975, partial [Planctomycetota bacterium]
MFSWISGQSQNDGVHRVAAGGCSKNRKPAGRNSGATLCYLAIVRANEKSSDVLRRFYTTMVST